MARTEQADAHTRQIDGAFTARTMFGVPLPVRRVGRTTLGALTVPYQVQHG